MAVDGLDLTVEDGAITEFVGPSGCGKTTSLRMINRMVEPTEGTVLLDGKDVRDSDPALLCRGIGCVIQYSGLFPHRTLLNNVATCSPSRTTGSTAEKGSSISSTGEFAGRVAAPAVPIGQDDRVRHP